MRDLLSPHKFTHREYEKVYSDFSEMVEKLEGIRKLRRQGQYDTSVRIEFFFLADQPGKCSLAPFPLQEFLGQVKTEQLRDFMDNRLRAMLCPLSKLCSLFKEKYDQDHGPGSIMNLIEDDATPQLIYTFVLISDLVSHYLTNHQRPLPKRLHDLVGDQWENGDIMVPLTWCERDGPLCEKYDLPFLVKEERVPRRFVNTSASVISFARVLLEEMVQQREEEEENLKAILNRTIQLVPAANSGPARLAYCRASDNQKLESAVQMCESFFDDFIVTNQEEGVIFDVSNKSLSERNAEIVRLLCLEQGNGERLLNFEDAMRNMMQVVVWLYYADVEEQIKKVEPDLCTCSPHVFKTYSGLMAQLDTRAGGCQPSQNVENVTGNRTRRGTVKRKWGPEDKNVLWCQDELDYSNRGVCLVNSAYDKCRQVLISDFGKKFCPSNFFGYFCVLKNMMVSPL